ncbi:MAG TPA: hypothetical protein VIM34_04825 [Burkholderiaceae bacterium]
MLGLVVLSVVVTPARRAPSVAQKEHDARDGSRQTVTVTIQSDASAWVQALATVAVAVSAVFSHRSAKEAVAAANASVVAARLQTQLTHVPFVRLGRPQMGFEPTSGPYIVVPAINVPAINLGPRLALELRLEIERRDGDAVGYHAERGRGVAPLPMLEAEARGEFKFSALDIASTQADWEEGMRAVGTGVPPNTQPIVPAALRLTVSYLSMLGATVKLTYIWETARIELPHDPWTWRLYSLTIDPGPGNGAPIVVTPPE